MALVLGVAMLTGAMLGSADVKELADRAGIPTEQLAGALNSQPGVDAEQYLIFDGLLQPQEAPYGVWDRVAKCESGGNWHTNTGNGFYGGVQFDYGSWKAAGGGKYATRADYATRSQQIEIANNWLALTSWRSWPACSRLLGLR